jgi:hypothetical protein
MSTHRELTAFDMKIGNYPPAVRLFSRGYSTEQIERQCLEICPRACCYRAVNAYQPFFFILLLFPEFSNKDSLRS